MHSSLTKKDILPLNEFLKIRVQKQLEILDIKKNRRVPVGSDVTFYFENFQTIWWQIHEMLRIEKGGDAQVEDELSAYTSLIPQIFPNGCRELVATMMIEIPDLVRRRQVLSQLGGIEDCIYLRFADTEIKAIPEEDLERTTEDGKTSSVHFLHFVMSASQVETLCQPGKDVILEVRHPHYSYKTLIKEKTRQSLSNDLQARY
jgi:hypothetical protein